jgi:hypothetical protein
VRDAMTGTHRVAKSLIATTRAAVAPSLIRK